jgi:hypothetical protein
MTTVSAGSGGCDVEGDGVEEEVEEAPEVVADPGAVVTGVVDEVPGGVVVVSREGGPTLRGAPTGSPTR